MGCSPSVRCKKNNYSSVNRQDSGDLKLSYGNENEDCCTKWCDCEYNCESDTFCRSCNACNKGGNVKICEGCGMCNLCTRLMQALGCKHCTNSTFDVDSANIIAANITRRNQR